MAGTKHIRTLRSKKLHPEHVKLINEAIRHNARGKEKDLHITYRKENGEESERKVRPLAVKGKSLFVAHCHERNAIRSFRVERIGMVKSAFWSGFDLWGTKKKQKSFLEKKEKESLQREKDYEEYLLGHIKKQDLEDHLKILDHPKADPKYLLMEEIVRRHGDPYGVIKSNSGGGHGHGPYHPNYPNKYWKSIGGKVDKDKKYLTFRQSEDRYWREHKMEKSAFWDGFEKRAVSAKAYGKALLSSMDSFESGVSKRPNPLLRSRKAMEASTAVATNEGNTAAQRVKALRNNMTRVGGTVNAAKAMTEN